MSKCLCSETSVILSHDLPLDDGKRVFVDLRFDAEHNDIDFEYGVLGDGNERDVADWSNNFIIRCCPICGLPLIDAEFTWYTPRNVNEEEAQYINQKCTVIKPGQAMVEVEFEDGYRLSVPRIELL